MRWSLSRSGAFLVLVAVATSHARAGLTPPDAICADTTWHYPADDPVVVTSGLSVGGTTFCPGNPKPTLTIEPGIEVRFALGKAMDVFGTLVARGTTALPIRFTSNEPTPAAADWVGIELADGSTPAAFDDEGAYASGSALEYVTIEYAGYGNGKAVSTSTSPPFLKDVSVQNCKAPTIIEMFSSGPAVRMRNVSLASNACPPQLNCTGISVLAGAGLAELTGIALTDNSFYTALYVQSTNGGSSVSQVQIANNDGRGPGISASGAGRQLVISDATVSGMGFGITGSGFTLQRAVIQGNAGIGVSAFNATIVQSLIFDNGDFGVSSGGDVSISDTCISSNHGGLEVNGASPITVRNTTIVNDVGDGILGLVYGPYGPVDVQECNLIQSAPVGQSGPYVVHNVRGSGSIPLTVTNDWWGTTDAAAIEDRVQDCVDDATRGCVLTDPPASGPIAGTPDISACAAGVLATSTTSTSTSTTTSSSTSTSSSTTTTTLAVCGDGLVQAGEQCDVPGLNGQPVDSCCDAACHFVQGGTVCRAGAVCSNDATCTGSSGTCPDNVAKQSGVPCRSAVGVCDLPESCDGIHDACPANRFQPSTEACGAAPRSCEAQAHCTGQSAFCPPKEVLQTSIVCRASAGECDLPERCDGAGPDCPADRYAEPGTSCGDPAETCRQETTCTGVGPTCPSSQPQPDGTDCIDPTCDPAQGKCKDGTCEACFGDAQVAGGAGKITVVCTLGDTAGDVPAECTAVGRLPRSQALAPGADARGCVPGCPDLAGTQLTKRGKARFDRGKVLGDASQRSADVRTQLRANRSAKQYLKKHANLDVGVCVEITDHFGAVRRKQCRADVTKPIRKKKRK